MIQGPVNTGTAAILIKVKDVEDQPPEFIHVPSVARISEDVNPGTQILYVKAIDGDRGINNKIKYFIEKFNNDLFEIEEDSGIVYTTTNLDRENKINGMYGYNKIFLFENNRRPLKFVLFQFQVLTVHIF